LRRASSYPHPDTERAQETAAPRSAATTALDIRYRGSAPRRTSSSLASAVRKGLRTKTKSADLRRPRTSAPAASRRRRAKPCTWRRNRRKLLVASHPIGDHSRRGHCSALFQPQRSQRRTAADSALLTAIRRGDAAAGLSALIDGRPNHCQQKTVSANNASRFPRRAPSHADRSDPSSSRAPGILDGAGFKQD
jgi:hypothetical protein